MDEDADSERAKRGGKIYPLPDQAVNPRAVLGRRHWVGAHNPPAQNPVGALNAAVTVINFF